MPRRSGYTMLELMLVLVLIIVVTALGFPIAEMLIKGNAVSSAADQVKARLVKIRSLAMAEGRVYTLKVMWGTGNFLLEPAEDSEMTVDGDDPPYVREDALPDGVVFVQDPSSLRGAVSTSSSSGYETVVTFYPEGIAKGVERDDVEFFFGMPNGGIRGFGVRGLTGAIYPIDPATLENRP